jgi:hypothetical protein
MLLIFSVLLKIATSRLSTFLVLLPLKIVISHFLSVSLCVFSYAYVKILMEFSIPLAFDYLLCFVEGPMTILILFALDYFLCLQ